MNQLFFELIRVTKGTQGCPSCLPKVGEWGESKKQLLVGFYFVGWQNM